LVKIVITGDSHLNLYNQKLGARLAERRGRIGAAWWKTIDYAIENKADIYIHTGDLFDQLSPRNPPRARVVEAFRLLKDAGIRSFIVAGNHEAPSSEMDGASPHAVLEEAGLADVFDSYTEFKQYMVNIDGVEVSLAGLGYNRRLGSGVDPLEGRMIPSGADLNIAVLHYSIESIAPPIWEEPTIKLPSVEANGEIQLFAMGHIHEHTEKKVNDSLIVYPGGTERYNFGEAGKTTGFVVAEYDGELKTRYVLVESQPMKQVSLHTSSMSREDINSSIIETVKGDSDGDGLLQLVLEGSIPFTHYAEIDFAELQAAGRAGNFYFEVVDRIKPTGEGLELTPSEGLNPRKRLEEIAQAALASSTGDEQEAWREAMSIAVEYYLKEKDE